MKINTIIQGDTLTELKKFPDEFVDCVITSPPYYGLRDYQVDGQLGLEDTFEEYQVKLLEIIAEIKRVLKKSGQFWLNLGDVYASSGSKETRFWYGDNAGKHKLSNDEQAGRCRLEDYQSKCLLMMPERIALKMVDKQGWILRNKIVWTKQCYHKKENKTFGSVMPTSVKDRFNQSWEYLYFFTKSKKYYSNLDAVRLSNQTFEDRPGGFKRSRQLQYDSKYLDNYSPQNKQSGQRFNYRVRDAERKAGQPQFKASEEEIKNYNKKSLESRLADNKNKDQKSSRTYNIKKLLSEVRLGIKPNTGLVKYDISKRQKELADGGVINSGQRIRGFFDEFGGENNPLGKNIPTVWQINPEPHNFQKETGVDCDHFAIFPEALLEIPIKFGCPKNGLVLDPFMGSGTTAVVARKLNRNYLGIELNKNYIKIAEKRLSQKTLCF